MHPKVLSNSDAPGDDGASAAEADSAASLTKPSTVALRVYGALVAAGCAGLLVTAWMLTPESAGYGTHRQMGMPGCSLMVNTGWPCPSCGMTTAVSAAVHGSFGAALRAQPFGIVLTLAAVVFGTTGLVELVSGRRPSGVLRLRWWYMIIALAGMLLGWAVKLGIGATDGTFPVR